MRLRYFIEIVTDPMISSIHNINNYKNVCRCILFQSILFIVFEYLTAVRSSASDWVDPRPLAKVGEMTFLITLPAPSPAQRIIMGTSCSAAAECDAWCCLHLWRGSSIVCIDSALSSRQRRRGAGGGGVTSPHLLTLGSRL